MSNRKSLEAVAAMTKARRGAAQGAPKPEKPKPHIPTPEQLRKGFFVQQDVVDATPRGAITIGKAHRRHAKFELIKGLGTEQIKALRAYRAAFDESERSEVRCALDIRPGGGGGSDAALTAIEARAFGKEALRTIESRLGGTVHTMRDVVLHDLSFSEVAMKRFGSREVDYIDVGKGKRKPRSYVKLAPRSGRHREVIREEFFQGLQLLVER